jgi:gliding motility-associated-like protein
MLRLTKFKNAFVVFLLITSVAKAQLTTSTTLTPAQLVQNILLGNGVTASNITFNGDPVAIGEFNGVSSNIGLPAGLIMSSGDVANAEGPNDQTGASAFNSSSGDPDLDLIMDPTESFDAAILEFDFIPTSDSINFRYVFGSEEYMEYVNSTPGGINDGFGFFVSGPGISGPFSNSAINIAIIPGTSLPVTMFNLNLNNNSTFYFDNGCGGCFSGGTAPDGLTVQYDGFTVPMTARAAVQCGQTYHIKIAIGDGGDSSFDSGVFLEAGSFSAAGPPSIASYTGLGGVVGGTDSLIYEGCGFANLLIKRSTTDTAIAQSFYYEMIGVAENGVDYDLVSDSVHFAIGQDSAIVTINTIPDLLIEGDESVTMVLYVSTTCGGADTLYKTVYIVDSPPLKVALNDDTSLVCPAQNLFITAQVAGGVAIGGHTYSWTNFPNSHSDTLQINPLTTTPYVVTVTDSCGNTATDTMVVNFITYTPMQLSLNADTVICEGQSVFLNADITGGLPFYNYLWSPNLPVFDTATVDPLSTTTYVLNVIDACGFMIDDTVVVTVDPISAAFDYTFSTNQTVQFINLSSNAVAYNWNFGDASDDSVSIEPSPEHYFPTDGYYTVTLVAENSNGCLDTVDRDIQITPDFYFYFPNSFTPNKNDKNDVYTGYGAGVKSYRMRIYNRWGQQVYESTDMTLGWDGTFKGKNCEPDAYVCVFDLESYEGRKTRKLTSITLVR